MKQKGYVYVIENENKKVKIGKSVRPKTRIAEISRMGCTKIVAMHITKKITYYSKFELFIHKHFKQSRVLGEWFNVSYGEIVAFVNDNVDIFDTRITEEKIAEKIFYPKNQVQEE